MPSDLQITNIKDQANANSAITIASDGQITVNQNNPTVTLGTNATFPAGHVIQVKRTQLTLDNGDYNENSFSSSTPYVVNDTDSNNLEITNFSASSGNILFVTWNFGIIVTASGNVVLMGFKVHDTFYVTNFLQGGAETSGNDNRRYLGTCAGSITLSSAISNKTISAAVSAPNNTASDLLHYDDYGGVTHIPSITVMEIQQ
jgi:hypothetical protein